MKIVFSGQIYWVPILFVASLFLAYFLYVGFNKPSRKKLKYPHFLLITLRTLGLFFLSLLLLSPYLKYESKTKHKPEITFLMDQSLSLNNQEGIDSFYPQFLKKAKRELEDYELKFMNLQGENVIDSQALSKTETNLSRALENAHTASAFEKAIVVCSDGIINAGANPNFYPLSIDKPIYTLGLGDTNTLQDIKVTHAKTNDFVLLGNDFPLEFNILAHACEGETIRFQVFNNGVQVSNGELIANSEQYFFSKQIKIAANQPGVQRIEIKTSTLENEKNKFNNSIEVYVNVLDNRKKVALLYQGAHPDVKAIRTALKAQKNYELTVTTSIPKALESDVIIAVQVPNRKANDNTGFNLINSQKPILLVGGEMMDWNKWSPVIGNLQIRTAQPNKSKFRLNETFSGFSTEPEDAELLEQLPPLTVPFAVYPKDLSAMSHQVINGIQTNYPLIATSAKRRRVAILFGEGVWRWSMREYAIAKHHHATENLFDHLVQWLLSGQDKPLFSVSSSKNRYTKNESIFLKAELYNQVFEPIIDAEIKAIITNDSFRKEVVFGNNGSYYSYDVGGLAPGNYKVVASNKGKTASTGFTVGSISLEERILKANWNLLALLSDNYKGSFYSYLQDDLLFKELKSKIDKTVVVKSQKRLKDLIQIPYVLMLIGFLFGLEWILRKYYGKL